MTQILILQNLSHQEFLESKIFQILKMFDRDEYRIRNEMERMLEHGLVIPVEKKSLPTKNKTDKPDPFKLYFK